MTSGSSDSTKAAPSDEQIRALCDAATLGPWKWHHSGELPSLYGVHGDATYWWEYPILDPEHHGECGCRSVCTLEMSVSAEDKAFIAAARSLVPALLARVVAAEAHLAASQTEVRELRKFRKPLRRIEELETQLAATQKINADHFERMGWLDARNWQLRRAVETLVRLKDGPRDDSYRAAKDTTWEVARSVLSSAPDTDELAAAQATLDKIREHCDRFGFNCYPSASTDGMPDRVVLVADVAALLDERQPK